MDGDRDRDRDRDRQRETVGISSPNNGDKEVPRSALASWRPRRAHRVVIRRHNIKEEKAVRKKEQERQFSCQCHAALLDQGLGLLGTEMTTCRPRGPSIQAVGTTVGTPGDWKGLGKSKKLSDYGSVGDEVSEEGST